MTFITLMLILSGLLLLFSAVDNIPVVDYARSIITTGKVPTA